MTSTNISPGDYSTSRVLLILWLFKKCWENRRTHITRDLCFPRGRTHINRDMCFPGGEHISLGICVSQVGEHISLGICVSQLAEHISPVRNIPKFKDRANWSRDTFQPIRRRACVYQQTNQNIAPVMKNFQNNGRSRTESVIVSRISGIFLRLFMRHTQFF